MTIEIRQISVRTTIVEGGDKKTTPKTPSPDYGALKRQLLKECRQLIREMMAANQER